MVINLGGLFGAVSVCVTLICVPNQISAIGWGANVTLPVRRKSSTRSPHLYAEEFEFHHVAQRPLYARCADWLMQHCKVDEFPLTMVDLGCGSGLLTARLLERFGRHDGVRIIGIDPSEPELKIAREKITDSRVAFVQGRAQDLPDFVTDAKVVLMCNVLHQIPKAERSELFKHVGAALKPGGVFGFNTLYYEGAVAPETRPFYSMWLLNAYEALRAGGIRATPTKRNRPPAFQQLTVEQHRELLVAAGFDDPLLEEPVFEWSLEDWKAISRYSVFIKNTLGSDIDLETGSQVLQDAAVAAFEALKLQSVPRRWLHVAARKRPGA